MYASNKYKQIMRYHYQYSYVILPSYISNQIIFKIRNSCPLMMYSKSNL